MSTEEQATPAPAQENPGQVLKARREEMGWSIEHIADQLKLAPRQVVALEAGDYDALPPAAVVRGFVRGYAKVLKIDATPLVAAIPVDAAAAAADASAGMRRERVAAPLPRVRYPTHGKRSRFPLGAVAGLVAVAAAVGAALYFLGMLPIGGPATGVAGTGALTEPVAAPALPSNGAVQGPMADPSLQQQSVPLISVPPPAPDPSAPTARTPAPAATAPANPAAATPPAGTPPPVTTRGIVGVPSSAEGAGGALVLNVKQDSWIEVRGSGKALISRLVRAGSTETVQINEPVTLVVGNPAGVDATLRGAAIALPATNGRTVSRQTLK